MKVRNLVNLGSNEYPSIPEKEGLEGHEHHVPEALGKVLVAHRHAVEIVEPVKEAPKPEPKAERQPEETKPAKPKA